MTLYCTVLTYGKLGEAAQLNMATKSTVPCVPYSSTVAMFCLTTHLLQRLIGKHLRGTVNMAILCCHKNICFNYRYMFHPQRGVIEGEAMEKYVKGMALKHLCTRPDRPWAPPSLLYNGYRISFPAVKLPGRGVDHPLPCSAEVKERVDTCLYHPPPSGPSRPFLGRTLPLLKHTHTYIYIYYFFTYLFFHIRAVHLDIYQRFFIHQLMHKWILLKTILKFTLKLTLKQLRHVSVQSHHHQGAHYTCLLKL